MTLREFIDAESAIKAAETWPDAMRQLLRHYSGLNDEAQASLDFDDAMMALAKGSEARQKIYVAPVQEALAYSPAPLVGSFDPAGYSMPRYADAEVYLTAFSGPRLFGPLASVIYAPEGDYDSEAALDRADKMLDLPAAQVVPGVLFFCKNAMSFASATR